MTAYDYTETDQFEDRLEAVEEAIDELDPETDKPRTSSMFDGGMLNEIIRRP